MWVLYWPLSWGADMQGGRWPPNGFGRCAAHGRCDPGGFGRCVARGRSMSGCVPFCPVRASVCGPRLAASRAGTTPLVRLLPNRSLNRSPCRVAFQSPGSGQEFGAAWTSLDYGSLFGPSVLAAPPLFSFQSPTTVLVPGHLPAGTWSRLAFC